MSSSVNVSDYLRGYITGYWEGFDFGRACVEEESKGNDGSADGAADSSSPAPSLDPAQTACSASAGPPPEGAPKGPAGSSDSADSSLPAIHQPALPSEVEVAGELENMYVHRGMVLALRAMAENFTRLQMDDAARFCQGAADIDRDWSDS